MSQLKDRAWAITQGINHHQLIRRDGVVYLLEFLRDRLGRTPVPDVGIRLEELMLRLRRSPGTSMSTWASQVRETYKRVQVALSRTREETKKPVLPISGGAREPEGPPSPGKKSSSHAESVFTERAEDQEDDVDLEHPAMDPGIQGTSDRDCWVSSCRFLPSKIFWPGCMRLMAGQRSFGFRMLLPFQVWERGAGLQRISFAPAPRVWSCSHPSERVPILVGVWTLRSLSTVIDFHNMTWQFSQH